MRTPESFVNLFLVLTTTLLAGCGTTERDWKRATDANTVSSYTDYLAKHPEGSHADEAHWNLAKLKDTLADYNRYLLDHAAGKHTVEAKTAIATIYTILFDSDKPLTNQMITVTGIVKFETPQTNPQLIRSYASLKVANGEFGILLDSPGEQMARAMDGKFAEVRGSLTGKATYDMTFSASTPFRGRISKVVRHPELRVEEYKLASDDYPLPLPKGSDVLSPSSMGSVGRTLPNPSRGLQQSQKPDFAEQYKRVIGRTQSEAH